MLEMNDFYLERVVRMRLAELRAASLGSRFKRSQGEELICRADWLRCVAIGYPRHPGLESCDRTGWAGCRLPKSAGCGAQ